MTDPQPDARARVIAAADAAYGGSHVDDPDEMKDAITRARLASALEALRIAKERTEPHLIEYQRLRAQTLNDYWKGRWDGVGDIMQVLDTLSAELSGKDTTDGEEQGTNTQPVPPTEGIGQDTRARPGANQDGRAGGDADSGRAVSAQSGAVGTGISASVALPAEIEALLKDYADTEAMARGWYHNVEQWGEESWVEGKSVDDLVNEKFYAIADRLRSLSADAQQAQQERDMLKRTIVECLTGNPQEKCPHNWEFAILGEGKRVDCIQCRMERAEARAEQAESSLATLRSQGTGQRP